MIQISCPSYLSVFLQVVIITNWTVDKLEVLGGMTMNYGY